MNWLERIERQKNFGMIPIIPCIFGKKKYIGKVEVVWWGWSQWYKWRRFDDHLDLGIISIYNINTQQPLWWLVAKIMKPMRIFYHKKYIHNKKES